MTHKCRQKKYFTEGSNSIPEMNTFYFVYYKALYPAPSIPDGTDKAADQNNQLKPHNAMPNSSQT